MTVEPLTARESEIAELLRTGASNLNIARKLGISHRTVSVHISSIKRKLAARTLNRSEFVLRLAQS